MLLGEKKKSTLRFQTLPRHVPVILEKMIIENIVRKMVFKIKRSAVQIRLNSKLAEEEKTPGSQGIFI